MAELKFGAKLKQYADGKWAVVSRCEGYWWFDSSGWLDDTGSKQGWAQTQDAAIADYANCNTPPPAPTPTVNLFDAKTREYINHETASLLQTIESRSSVEYDDHDKPYAHHDGIEQSIREAIECAYLVGFEDGENKATIEPSAADALLAACKAIDEHWTAGNFSREEAMWAHIRAAIAKAEGGAK